MANPYSGLDFQIDDEEERRRQLADMSAMNDGTGGPGQPPPEESGIGTGEPEPGSIDIPNPQMLEVREGPTTAAPQAPPPPPPPPPAFDPLTPQLAGFTADWLDNPNRYLTDMAQAQREASVGRLQSAEEEAQVALDERMAQRGLSGSTLEDEANRRLQRDLQQVRSEDEARILEMLASVEGMDRERAAQLGLETIRAGDVMGLDRYRAELEAEQLKEAQRQFGGTLGISQQQIDLRARELMESARLEGRALDLEQARDLANQQLTREQMQQEQGQFQSTLAQREAEFARTLGLSEREFEEQQRQFSAQYGEQVASRLQQNEQFKAALESENARYAMDVGLRSRALDLQEQGMAADDAYRQAALAQEKELTEAAQDLQRQGMEMDDAYRYAALLQDAEFRTRALDLQEQGMNLDEAFRQAEAEREMERFDQMMEIWRDAMGDNNAARRIGETLNDTLTGTGIGGGGGGGLDPDDAKRFLEWLRGQMGGSLTADENVGEFTGGEVNAQGEGGEMSDDEVARMMRVLSGQAA